jgi:predicted ATPase
MDNRLVSLEVENFRSLRKITLPLGPVTVLVGPNGVGKTNVIKVFEFLADIVRADLGPALAAQGGFDEVVFHGGEHEPDTIRIKVSLAEDEYELDIIKKSDEDLRRIEQFNFGSGTSVGVIDRLVVTEHGAENSSIGISEQSSGLSTLPRLYGEAGSDNVAAVARQLSSIRVFDVSVEAARNPGRISRGGLAGDASNLASFLFQLSAEPRLWQQLIDDACFALPQLESISVDTVISDGSEVGVFLQERGMRRRTPLKYASYGTVRMLSLLALLYDPHPPTLTCVEEIENGLHPQALEMLVERIREASDRTQFLIATHSPALADRLYPDEFVVCERTDDGASAIPAIPPEKVKRIVRTSENLPLGELWFSGALGGDL